MRSNPDKYGLLNRMALYEMLIYSKEIINIIYSLKIRYRTSRYYQASQIVCHPPVVSFTKKVTPQLAKHLLKTNGRLANLELTSLV